MNLTPYFTWVFVRISTLMDHEPWARLDRIQLCYSELFVFHGE